MTTLRGDLRRPRHCSPRATNTTITAPPEVKTAPRPLEHALNAELRGRRAPRPRRLVSNGARTPAEAAHAVGARRPHLCRACDILGECATMVSSPPSMSAPGWGGHHAHQHEERFRSRAAESHHTGPDHATAGESRRRRRLGRPFGPPPPGFPACSAADMRRYPLQYLQRQESSAYAACRLAGLC